MPEARSAPCVSVLLPVRDGSAFLAVAIESILGQTLADLELLAIDDGSQDGTPAILERLAAFDQRIRVFRQAPLGITAALNRGLRESRAALVARMDADDIAAPERLSRQFAALNTHPSAVAVGSACRVINRSGKLLGYRRPPIQPDAIRRVLIGGGNCMIHPTMMLRRDAVLRAGGYRAPFRYCEDFDLWLRLSEHHDLINLPDTLLDYREHERQLTWQNLEARVVTELAVLVFAARRRAGVADTIDENTRIDRGFLFANGVSEQTIANHVIASTLGTAREAIKAGLVCPAREALELLLRQPGLATRTRIRAFALLLRCYVNLWPLRPLLARQQPV